MKSIFERKPDWRLSDFVIEKTVQIPDEDFEKMLQYPMKTQPWIEDNIDLMYRDNHDIFHCILVTGQERTDGILIESEGYAYARYASYVLETSALGYPSLAKWNRKITSAVEFMIRDGIHQQKKNGWKLTYEELEKQTGLCLKGQSFLQEIFRDILLCERQEVLKLDMKEDYLEIVYAPEFDRQSQDQHPVSSVKLQF